MSKRISHDELHEKCMKNDKYKESYQQACKKLELLEKMLKARKKSGLTQAEVAAIMGTSTSVVGRLETGGHSPKLDTLERYAAAMGYKVKIDFVKEENLHGH